MSRSRGAVPSLAEGLEGASNVLLLVPTMDPADSEGCTSLLTLDPPADEDVLCVALTQSPDDRLEVWRSNVDARPAKAGFVNVSDPARSIAPGGDRVAIPGQSITISSVSSPSDLTGLGIEISEYLTEWADDGNRIVVCFHSLTALLQYVDVQPTFRFLHVLTGRLAAVDAIAHFHLDPTAYDERTINTLKTLFDAVVEPDDDGGWALSRR